MKTKVFTLLFMLLSSSFAFAQKSELNGTWKLEAVVVINTESNTQMEFDEAIQIPQLGLFEELTFQGNNLTISENGNPVITGTTEITGSTIKITLSDRPSFEAQFRFSEGQLLLERQGVVVSVEGQSKNDVYMVAAFYARK